MKFDTPAGANPIDQAKVVGKPLPRIEGPLKTTGTAVYSYEHHDVAPNAAYGYILGAGVAKGRIASIDVSRAKAAPGVLAVITADNAGPIKSQGFYVAKLLAGPEVDHYHQASPWWSPRPSNRPGRPPTGSASTTRVRPGAFDLAAARDGVKPNQRTRPKTQAGDFEGAFAPRRVQGRPDLHDTRPDATAMMEPHATIAAWDGDQLTLWTSIRCRLGQARSGQHARCPKDKMRLVALYRWRLRRQGLFVCSDAALAALGARLPVVRSRSRCSAR
jgi:xanthine dehydrogenase YagR molybdenum-binding subunit